MMSSELLRIMGFIKFKKKKKMLISTKLSLNMSKQYESTYQIEKLLLNALIGGLMELSHA